MCVLFVFFCRHWWLQTHWGNRGYQQHIPSQQDRLSNDIWRWLQCLLGLLCQLPRHPCCVARQHSICSSHGQNRALVYVRYEYFCLHTVDCYFENNNRQLHDMDVTEYEWILLVYYLVSTYRKMIVLQPNVENVMDVIKKIHQISFLI